MGSYNLVKQVQVRKLATVVEGSTDASLIGSANLNQAYRVANLTTRQFVLNDFTKGAFVSVKTTIDGDTGTLELWGYPAKGGAAQFFGSWTFVTDEAVDDKGLFYVDNFSDGTSGQHTASEKNLSDGVATIQFETLGLKYIVALITVFASTATPGYATVELRPY